jgi:protein-disulfide isomerase
MLALRSLLAVVIIVAGCDSQRSRSERLRAVSGVRVPIEHSLLDPVVGSDSAPVEIVVFGNPHCRACDRALERILSIQEKRPDDVRLVYKWMGDPEDADQLRPARALYAAAALGCFLPFHEQQSQTHPRTDAELELVAGTAGCGGEAFRATASSADVLEAVRASAREGQALDIRSTPRLVINGRVIAGNPPTHALASVIDAELRSAAQARRPNWAAINQGRVR